MMRVSLEVINGHTLSGQVDSDYIMERTRRAGHTLSKWVLKVVDMEVSTIVNMK